MDLCLLKALSDPNRLKMVELLLRHSCCVRALSIKLGLSESSISQHMKILRDAGLVEGVKYGYYTHYRLNRELLKELRDQLDALIAIEYKGGKANCDMVEAVGCAQRTEIKLEDCKS